MSTTDHSNPKDVQIECAKKQELEAWKSHNVYNEVPNEGQDCMSVRWVVTPKVIDGVASVKARLVAKGFKELQNFRKDSPTCSRESIRLALATIASKKWNLQGIDITRAFLQGNQIDHVVYLKLPSEANTQMLWRLNKCVYGLGDASRAFYLKLDNELTQLKAQQSTLDQGLYFYFENELLAGILVAHVDDILYGGNDSFLTIVIQPLSQALVFGTEHYRVFEYLGVELIQNSDFSISVNQNNFARTIKAIHITDGCQGDDLLTVEQREMFRTAVGQLTWLTGISRPEISSRMPSCKCVSISDY